MKRKEGMFKGEFVFLREFVTDGNTDKKWLYQCRKVRESELDKPAKIVKKRKAAVRKSGGGPGSFKALKNYASTDAAADSSKEAAEKEKKSVEEQMADEVSNFSHIFQSHSKSKVFSLKHFTNIIIPLHLICQK